MLHSEPRIHWRTRSRVLAALLSTAVLLALGQVTRALQTTTGPPAAFSRLDGVDGNVAQVRQAVTPP